MSRSICLILLSAFLLTSILTVALIIDLALSTADATTDHPMPDGRAGASQMVRRIKNRCTESDTGRAPDCPLGAVHR